MASPFASLRQFAQTRNGKITVGVTAVGGVVGAALLTRHKGTAAPADGGATAAATTPSYLQASGTSGANAGEAPVDNSSGSGVAIDPGQFQDLLTGLSNATDALNGAAGNQNSAPPPAQWDYVTTQPDSPGPVTVTAPVPTYNPPPMPAPSALPAPAAPPPPAPRTYTVKSGDNLSVIAQRYYGTQDWQKIYNANKGVIGSNPNLIKPGQVLVIP